MIEDLDFQRLIISSAIRNRKTIEALHRFKIGVDDFPSPTSKNEPRRFTGIAARVALQHHAKYDEPICDAFRTGLKTYCGENGIDGDERKRLLRFSSKLTKLKPPESLVEQIHDAKQKKAWADAVEKKLALIKTGRMTPRLWEDLSLDADVPSMTEQDDDQRLDLLIKKVKNKPKLSKYVVKGVIPYGATLLYATWKLGKSWFADHYACALASGGMFLGGRAEQMDEVWLYALEGSEDDIAERFEYLYPDKNEQTRVRRRIRIRRVWPGLGVLRVGRKAKLWQRKNPGKKLAIIIDPMLGTDENDKSKTGSKNWYQEAYNTARKYTKLAEELHVPILMTDHTVKPSKWRSDMRDKNRNSGSVAAAFDTLSLLEEVLKDAVYKLEIVSRYSPEQTLELVRNVDDDFVGRSQRGFQLKDADPKERTSGTPVEDAILKVLKDNPEGLRSSDAIARLIYVDLLGKKNFKKFKVRSAVIASTCTTLRQKRKIRKIDRMWMHPANTKNRKSQSEEE